MKLTPKVIALEMIRLRKTQNPTKKNVINIKQKTKMSLKYKKVIAAQKNE